MFYEFQRNCSGELPFELLSIWQRINMTYTTSMCKLVVHWPKFIMWQISRSIGDAYLKKAEFNKEPLLPKFRVPESFKKPILQAEPAILIQKLQPEDQFLIFASDGLWEHLSNQEAVNIVNTCPRNVRFLFVFLFDVFKLAILLWLCLQLSSKK